MITLIIFLISTIFALISVKKMYTWKENLLITLKSYTFFLKYNIFFYFIISSMILIHYGNELIKQSQSSQDYIYGFTLTYWYLTMMSISFVCMSIFMVVWLLKKDTYLEEVQKKYENI